MTSLFEKFKKSLGLNKNPELEEELKLDKEIERLSSLDNYEEEIKRLKMHAMIKAIVNGKAKDLEEAEKYVTDDDLDIERHIEMLKSVSEYKKEQRKLEKQQNKKKLNSKKSSGSSFRHIPFTNQNDDDYYDPYNPNSPYNPYNSHNNPFGNFGYDSNKFSETDKCRSYHIGTDTNGHDVYKNPVTGEYNTVDSSNTIVNSQYHEPWNIHNDY